MSYISTLLFILIFIMFVLASLVESMASFFGFCGIALLIFLPFWMVFYAIFMTYYTRYDHWGWKRHSKPDSDAKIKDIKIDTVSWKKNDSIFEVIVLFSDGFYYKSYSAEISEHLFSYTISLSEQRQIAIIRAAKGRHIEEVNKVLPKTDTETEHIIDLKTVYVPHLQSIDYNNPPWKNMNNDYECQNSCPKGVHGSGICPIELLNEANVFMQSKDYSQTLCLLKKALVLAPDYALIWNALGECYEFLGDYDKALKAFKTALLHSPDLARAKCGVQNAKKHLSSS